LHINYLRPSYVMLLVKKIVQRHFIFFSLLLTINVYAVDDDVKKMLTEASGVTDEDAFIASRKKDVTLFDMYALAVKNTERLAIEGENSIQAEARRAQAFGAFLPKVYLRANKYFADNYLLKSGSQNDTVTLYARQPIMTGLDEFSSFKGALSDVKIKKYSLYNNSSQLLLDLSLNFYNIIQIEKNIKNNEEILNLYKLTINELNRRAAIGRSRKSEVQRTNSELYKLEAEHKALNSTLMHARLVLKTLCGTANDLSLKESNELPDPVYNINEIKNIIDRRWDVKAATEAVKQAEARVIAAYGGNLPSVYIDGTYLLYSKNQKDFNTSFNKQDYYFSLGVELPIFSGGIAFAKVKEAQSLKRQSELNQSRTIRFAEQDIIDSYQSWDSSKIEADAFKKALVSAEENYNTVNNEYRLNLVTILDVITSLRSLQSARDDYERSVLLHKLNRIKLGVATNELSGKNISLLKSEQP
jgi:outer membrane protein